MPDVTVIGAGLAGCEAAFQLAERGVAVTLIEQKPGKRTGAQTSPYFAELVCSNSMRGADVVNAVGLLKEELRRCGSLVLRVADATRVPAGGALAVDRERFGQEMTRVMMEHPRIRVESREVCALPDDRPVVLATGPLTGDALASELAQRIGSEHLAYYDAIAPIVATDSIDFGKVWRQSRYDKGEPGCDQAAYINCPFDEAQYRSFVREVCAAQKVPPRDFEEARYFEGCLPFEVMAERGEMTLAFGPMKPVGLRNPHSDGRLFAVVQLRQEDEAGTAYNLVGFQTRMTYGEQARIFRTIPGLENVEILRYGSVHRNTFLNAPHVLDEHMQLRCAPGVFVAGQLSGVEGYVESAAGGFLCGLYLSRALAGRAILPPPPTTALGALRTHLSRPVQNYQPSNVTWALFPPADVTDKRMKKRERYAAMAERALQDSAAWWRDAHP